MLPDRVSNPGPLTYESGALPIALHGPAVFQSYQACESVIVKGKAMCNVASYCELLFYVHCKQLRSCPDGQLT